MFRRRFFNDGQNPREGSRRRIVLYRRDGQRSEAENIADRHLFDCILNQWIVSNWNHFFGRNFGYGMHASAKGGGRNYCLWNWFDAGRHDSQLLQPLEIALG